MADEEDEVFPPENFAMVEPGVYRSGFPIRRNFTFLARLGLRTILTLVLEEYPPANCDFNQVQGIQLLQFGMEGNKEPFRAMPEGMVRGCLVTLLDPRNRPLLIHCNEGKHRTGCLVGCLRKMRGWSLSSILDEYLLYAGPKARMVDQRFIELFRPPQAQPQPTPNHTPALTAAPNGTGPYAALAASEQDPHDGTAHASGGAATPSSALALAS